MNQWQATSGPRVSRANFMKDKNYQCLRASGTERGRLKIMSFIQNLKYVSNLLLYNYHYISFIIKITPFNKMYVLLFDVALVL